MKVNAAHVFTDLDGAELKEEGKLITLSLVAVRALYTPLKGDDEAPFEKQAERDDLAVAFHKGGEVEITPENAVVLRERIRKVWGPRVAVPAYRMLG